ncbi:MAG: family 1 glycosylhydrolase [Cyanobacteria bacterium P01_A01_bin.84]
MSNLHPFPKSFIFGVATADHQVEAYDPQYEDIRDVWERNQKLTKRGKATDFWNRYPEDIGLAKSLGCKAFRFSIAWSRVEPKPGEFNEAAFEHYRQLIECIKSHDMEPIVTLHHFTHPIHVEARGGLIADEFPSIYAQYVTQVAKRLGNSAKYWISFNEPSQLIYGYVKPWWEESYFMPPGLPPEATMQDQMAAVGQLMRNLFVAHTRGREILKQYNSDARVGANPMLLGLPVWLQKLVDLNVTRLGSKEDLIQQGKRFTEPQLLEKGKVDVVIANFTVNQERQQQVAFSDTYYIAEQTVMVKSQSPIQQLANLNGKIVAVIESSTAQKCIGKLLPTAIAKVFKNYEAAKTALDYEQVDGILADDTILMGIIQQFKEQYKLIGEKLTQEPYAAAIVKGDRTFLHTVNTALHEFKTSGAWVDSYQRYFPGQVVPDLPESIANQQDNIAQSYFHSPILERIKKRGYLIVAVKDNVPGFSYLNPRTKKFEGLEIDFARQVAKQILGDANKIKFYPVTTQKRLPVLRSFVKFLDPIFKTFGILSTSITSNWWHLGMAGKLPTFLCPVECVGKQDFVGLDYYWGISNLRIDRIRKLWDAAKGRFGNAPVWSSVLYDMLQFHAQMFPGKEIMILENGCVEEADGVKRHEYISQHIHQVQRAVNNGVNIIGYISWCITSNREWGHPFDNDSDFGLYHIDLDNDPDLKRIPSIASEVYREIVDKGNVNE